MSRVAIAVRMTRDRNPALSSDQAQARLCITQRWRLVEGVECSKWPLDRIQAMVVAIAHGHTPEAVGARLGATAAEVRRKLFSVCDATLAKVYARS